MKQYQLKNKATEANLKINYSKELNPEQLKVVQNGEGACLVLAGAGSGKTRTLVYRVAWLIEHGIRPQNILLVTFTNKASREMLARVKTLLKQELKGLWGGTFHHIGNRILRQYISQLGYKNNYAILDQQDSKELVASSLAELPFDTKSKVFPKSNTVQAIISFANNSKLSVKEVISRYYRKFESFTAQIEAASDIYQQKKKKSNALDYDDLLVLWLKLLNDFPDIRERLASQFRYVLVDEYQDTNHIQAAIIKQLSSVHGNVLVVGDDAQSIYSFRAADVNNILDFPDNFKNTKIFKLETNYRSTQDILHLANESIRHNKKLFEKTLKHVRDDLRIKPGLVPLPDSGTQAGFLVQRILEMQEEDYNLRDVAVLFRAAHHTLELEVELARHNIPYIKRGGLKYFELAHIKDLVAYLKVLVNPLDEVAWRRVLKLYEGIGDKSASLIWAQISKTRENYLNLLASDEFIGSLSAKVGRSIAQLAKLLASCQQLLSPQQNTAGQALSNELGTIIKKIIQDDYREIVMGKYDDGEERLQDLGQLADFALTFSSVEEFLSDVALSEGYRSERFGSPRFGEAGIGTEDEEEDYLILSTIHQAKGLEWPVVFVISLVEGQFPHSRALIRDEDLEEERRLFYVAVTRAKDELYLTYPQTSFYGSGLGRTLSGPSRFITELPEKVYELWQIGPGFGESVIDLEDL